MFAQAITSKNPFTLGALLHPPNPKHPIAAHICIWQLTLLTPPPSPRSACANRVAPALARHAL